MSISLMILIFVTVTYLPTYSYGEDGGRDRSRPNRNEWQPREMNSRMGQKIEIELKPGSGFCGFFTECKFDLHYFFSRNYDGPGSNRELTSNGKPWILFISGGPGEIVHREQPYLWYMDWHKKANIVYFDVRGTGFSMIPASKTYDEFLHAKYVVEDIEALRKSLLKECDFSSEGNCNGVTRWNAIYANSWGTIVAQMYASKYRHNVDKLILAAPVSRGHHSTDEARRKMMVDNLLDIFDKHSTERCLWDGNDPLVKHRSSPFSDLSGVENFCFLTKRKKPFIKDIQESFGTLLNNIETEYGSVNFVTSFYNQFRDDSEFRQKYPYPREFFDAIRELEDFGSGELQGLSFDPTIRQRKIGTAMYLAYYLWLPKLALTQQDHFLYPGNGEFAPECVHDTDFFGGLQDTPHDNLKYNFCMRIVSAWVDLNSTPSSLNQSARARSVFSLNDGLAQWIFEIMKRERRVDHQGCFRGNDIQDIAKGDARLQTVVIKSTVIKEQAGKLGLKGTDRICPWDPARFNHDVDTLVLKGGADAITAGEQAEYIFEKGLTSDRRALIEFPGVGHAMNYQVKVADQEPDELDKAISDFKEAASGSKMEKDVAYKALLEKLKERRDMEKRLQKETGISKAIDDGLLDMILGFVTSKTVRDFTHNGKAMAAVKTLGGCLRTEDKKEFSTCICELTKSRHPVCKILTKDS